MRKLLSCILSCGVADVDYIIELFEDFDVDMYDIDYDGKDANAVIEEIFLTAVRNAGIDEDEHEVDTYTNCLDSHLYIDAKEVYSMDELTTIAEDDEGEDDDDSEEEDEEKDKGTDKKRFTGKNKRKYL